MIWMHNIYQKLYMEMNTNIFGQTINIEHYLNLSTNNENQQHHNTPLYDQDYQDDGFGSLLESQILLHKGDSNWGAGHSTIPSEISAVNQKKSAKQATAKYRQRRKKYQQQLQKKVKSLQQQIQATDSEIKKVKDAVLIKLQNSVKAVHNSENAEIFNELEACLLKNIDDEDLIDVDKLNLLLNTLKYRIGPSGRERQAKIQYNFKNVINTLFSGLIRYVLISATKNLDIFSGESVTMSWTQQLLRNMNLTNEQVQKIRLQQNKLKSLHSTTLKKIKRLHEIKKKMKEEAELVDNAQDHIREYMKPIQCAKWTMFCQKHKYRKDISLDQKFKPKNTGCSIQDEMEQLLQYKLGRKRVHRETPKHNK